MTEPEKRLTPPSPATIMLARMLVLEKAAGFLGGKDAVASAIGIETRSLRAKMTADRGVHDSDLAAVAVAIDARVDELTRFAGKVREMFA